jgi:hypothetical protein
LNFVEPHGRDKKQYSKTDWWKDSPDFEQGLSANRSVETLQQGGEHSIL